MENIQTKQEQVKDSYMNFILSTIQEINDVISPDDNQYLALAGLEFVNEYEIYSINHDKFVFSGDGISDCDAIENMMEMVTKVLYILSMAFNKIRIINFNIVVTQRGFIIIIDEKKDDTSISIMDTMKQKMHLKKV